MIKFSSIQYFELLFIIKITYYARFLWGYSSCMHCLSYIVSETEMHLKILRANKFLI